jgi:hypothetical protein
VWPLQVFSNVGNLPPKRASRSVQPLAPLDDQ